MNLQAKYRKIYNYVRYDLKEIAFPSSLPDPPGTIILPKLTIKQKYLVLKEASRLYIASWTRDIRPELFPDKYKKTEENVKENEEMEMSSWEELAVAAKGGMETMRPVLQRLYMTRVESYRDALKAFIEGYQEGIKQVLDEREKGGNGSKENGENKGS